MGAAPSSSRRSSLITLAVLTCVVLVAGHADARVAQDPSAAHKAHVWNQLWAVAVAEPQQLNASGLKPLRADGINALLITRGRWGTKAHNRLVRLARQNDMVVIEPRGVPRSTSRSNSLDVACGSHGATVQPCALQAGSLHQAVRLAHAGAADVVVVHLSSPRQLSALSPNASPTRIIGIIGLGAASSNRTALSLAIKAARTNPATTIAVGPATTSPRVLGPYLSLLHRNPPRRHKLDTSPPTNPPALRQTGGTVNSLTVAWNPSHDNTGVRGYRTYLDGVPKATTTATVAVFTNLACGTSHMVGVAAFDAAGNVSVRSTVRASTLTACGSPVPAPSSDPGSGGGGSSPTPDTQPPSTPGNLKTTAATQTSVSLAWDASTDNVGVSGYGVYQGSSQSGTTGSTNYTVSGLACGTSYSLSVDAYDAAGNHSGKATVLASTDTCPSSSDNQPPSTPGNLKTTAATQTSVSLAWDASTDNVGVSGYGVYQGSSQSGTTGSTNYTVSGLTCGTSYSLSVDAYDAAGNHSGKATVLVSTATCPPSSDGEAPSTPTGLHSTSATTGSVSLAWDASTDNVGVSGYGVYQGSSQSGTTGSTNYTVSGLTCGTSYSLSVDAYDAAGNHSGKATISASTAACTDTQPPSTPGNLKTTAATQTSVSLAWDASTDNVGVSGYGVYQGSSQSGTTGSTNYTVSGLTCGTSYSLSVDAYDAAGNHSGKATVLVSTATCPPSSDGEAPSTPTGLHSTSATTGSVSLAWDASTDNVGVSGYGVYQGSSQSGTTGSTNYTVSGLTCGTSYSLSVDAYDAAGNHSGKATISASTAACTDTQPPSTPGNLKTTAATQTSVSLAWDASTDNVGVTGYEIHQDSWLLASTGSTSYTVSGLACGTSYSLSVDAYDAAGNRSLTASLTASTTACPDTAAPSMPTGLHSTGTTTSSVSLAWTGSTDNVGVTGYGVYQGSNLSGSTSSTTYTVSGLTCGTSYSLSVDAYDAAGNRSGKATVSATTSACVDTAAPSTPTGLHSTTATTGSVSLAWTASTDNVGVAGYGIYQGSSQSGTTGSTNYTVSGLTCGTSYSLSVDAYDAAGNHSGKATVSATTSACADTAAPSTPTGLHSTSATTGSVSLAWTASTDDVGVAGYGIYQGSSQSGTTGSTIYTVSGLACGTSYSLSVDAYDAAGNHSGKATVSAPTAACSGGGGGGSGTANIFISTSGTSCHRYPTPVSYSSAGAANACGPSSWATACSLAQSGDVVEIEGGSYPGQDLSNCTGHAGYAQNVVFTAAQGASVAMSGEFNIRPSQGNPVAHLTFKGLTINSDYYIRYSQHIVMADVNAEGFYIRGSDDVQLTGGSIGGTSDLTPTIGSLGAGLPGSTNITIDGVYFHDLTRTATGQHTECLFVQESDHVLIENSEFVRCDTISVYANPIFGGTISNLTIVNNIIHAPTDHAVSPAIISGYPLNLGTDGTRTNYHILFNSLGGGLYIHPDVTNSAYVIEGNVGSIAGGSCVKQSGITYRYNTWSNASCDSTDVNAPSAYMSPDSGSESGLMDFHLQTGAKAIASVPVSWCSANAGTCPAADYDGVTRPNSAHPTALNAGAFENH